MPTTLDVLQAVLVFAKVLVQKLVQADVLAGARVVAETVVKTVAERRATLLAQTVARAIAVETVARIAAFRVKGCAFKNARTTVLVGAWIGVKVLARDRQEILQHNKGRLNEDKSKNTRRR